MAFIGLAIFPLLIAGVLLSWQSFNNQQTQAIQIQREIGQRIAEQTSSLIGNAEAQLEVLGFEPGIFDDAERQQHSGHFATVLSSSKFFEDLVLLDSNGQMLAHIGRAAHSDSVDRDLANRLIDDGSLTFSNAAANNFGPVRFDGQGGPTMSISVPVIDKRTGALDGFIIGIVRLGVIWELIGQIRVGDAGTAYIIDGQNRVIAHRNPSFVLKQTLFVPPDSDGIGPGLNGGKSIISRQEISIGDQRFWVITEKPFSEAMALTIRTLVTIGIILLTAMIASAVMARLAGRLIVRPIEVLVNAAQGLEAGDLDMRVKVTSQDEIGTLGNAFNSMADRILTTIEDLGFRNRELRDEVSSRQIAEAELENRTYELQSSNNALEIHYMISQIFSETGEFRGKAEAALEKLILLTGADLATFRISKSTGPGLHLVAAAGPALENYEPMPVLTDDLTISAEAYVNGETFVTDDYASLPEASQFLIDMGMQSLIFLPVFVRDRTFGLVTVISQNKHHFSDEIIDTLGFGVERLGVLVENSILHDESEESNKELQSLAEALSRSNGELEQFANIVSHDLQEPLRMVSSYMQLLESRYKNVLDADAQLFIGYAVDGAKRMQTQIRDLLAYSRLATQGSPFDPTDCSDVLDLALSNLTVSIQESKATITSDPLPVVMGDNPQLVSVFQNLIGNAIKYTGDKTPRIHVSAVESGKDWLFSFSDTGIGIEAEYADRIFLIFQRLHGKGEYDGTGIGLAICKKVIERHGGRIWVESEPEKGSTFYFTLPKEKSSGTNLDGAEVISVG